MNRRLFIASVGAASSLPFRSRAETHISEVRSLIVGTWLVLVEGDDRPRKLIVEDVDVEIGTSTASIVASYGWASKDAKSVSAQIVLRDRGPRLNLKTPADSTIVVDQQKDGSFAGTIEFKGGRVKGVALERTTPEGASLASFRVNPSSEISLIYLSCPKCPVCALQGPRFWNDYRRHKLDDLVRFREIECVSYHDIFRASEWPEDLQWIIQKRAKVRSATPGFILTLDTTIVDAVYSGSYYWSNYILPKAIALGEKKKRSS